MRQSRRLYDGAEGKPERTAGRIKRNPYLSGKCQRTGMAAMGRKHGGSRKYRGRYGAGICENGSDRRFERVLRHLLYGIPEWSLDRMGGQWESGWQRRRGAADGWNPDGSYQKGRESSGRTGKASFPDASGRSGSQSSDGGADL